MFQRGFLGQLVDFFCGDDSPNLEIGNIPVNDKGKRVEMGTKWRQPDWTHFLFLVQRLVAVSALGAPVNGEGMAEAAAVLPDPPLPLDPAQLALVTSKAFLSRLIRQATSRKRGKAVNAILASVCWENEALSQSFVSTIILDIDSEPYDKIRPHFRVVSGLINVSDSLQVKRVDWILSSLLTSMEGQQRYLHSKNPG